MNSLSDARLQGYAEECDTAQQPQRDSIPAGLGCWGLMLHRRQTRKALLQLDDAQLRDVGLTREQARREGSKPFWRR